MGAILKAFSVLNQRNLYNRYDLNHRVDRFIKNYSEALKKANVVTDIGEYLFPEGVRNFIEAKAVYAELRWPIVYPHHEGMVSAREANRKAQQQFLWETFDDLHPHHGAFPLLELTDRRLNQQVLHRVIERGGNRAGPRRGVLFAQEQELPIDLPVSYGIDFSDPYLYDFLAPHIQGLNKNILCPTHYFARSSERLSNVHEITLGEAWEREQEYRKAKAS